MARIRRRAPRPGRTAGEEPPQTLSVLPFHFKQRPFEDLPLWDEHEIEGLGALRGVQPKGLPKEALGPVPFDGPADLSRGREAESVVAACVHCRDEREQRSVQPEPAAEDVPELGPGAQMLRGPEPAATAAGHRLRPRSACALSAGVSSGPDGRPWSASAPGSRGSACAFGCSAGRSASSLSPCPGKRGPPIGPDRLPRQSFKCTEGRGRLSNGQPSGGPGRPCLRGGAVVP